jgi:hypothetical protein
MAKTRCGWLALGHESSGIEPSRDVQPLGSERCATEIFLLPAPMVYGWRNSIKDCNDRSRVCAGDYTLFSTVRSST